MTKLTQNFEAEQQEIPANVHLVEMGKEILMPLTKALAESKTAIQRMVDVSDPHLSKRATTLLHKLDAHEPSITLVGQVKAGKTALVNVMAGRVNLLPSDVNPWTTVVTTLHLNPKMSPDPTKAKFTFFDKDEWGRLMKNGGRMGEMANRAGASEEKEKIRKQVEEMLKKTKARLGDSFEALLGQVHKYDYYDQELIERYVCMGDEDLVEEDPTNKQGQFADLTKSAELNLYLPQIGMPISLRDTPGVNDTFMVREQLTLNALRGSEICLVVLSAHQALNTTDMALIRMISNFEKRQIILFVNRIDELAQPSEQVPEIRKSIIETLKASNAPQDCEIIFGSAKWAEAALLGDMNHLDEESQAALLDWATGAGSIDAVDEHSHTWILSGMAELTRAINNRILEGPGHRLLSTVRNRIDNMANEMKAEKSVIHLPVPLRVASASNQVDLKAALDTLVAGHEAQLRQTTEKLLEDLKPRLKGIQDSFVRRATDALIVHLEHNGQQKTWQYDPMGLRLLLRSAYARFAVSTKKQVGAVFAKAAEDIEQFYVVELGVNIDGFRIKPPIVPTVPAPVVLGKTIALDLNASWWRRWWQKRKGFDSFAKDYASLIHVEVASIIEELEQKQIAELFKAIDTTLQDFLQEQRDSVLNLSTTTSTPTGQTQTEAAIDDAMTALDRLAS